MTLIEIMVVIVILALAAAGVTMALGAVTKSKLRSGCAKIVAASRYAYSRAATTGNTVRILIEFGDGEDAPSKMAIQEAHGRVVLSRGDDPRREASEEEDGDGVAVDPWAAAQQRLETTLEPTFGASPFGPITGRGGEALDKYKAQEIGDDVRAYRLITPHDPDPREGGVGAIYFFPGGQAEHAVLQLTQDYDTVYSVEIHPLTGRAVVHDYAFEPEPIRDPYDDDERSEVEDPG